MPPLRSSRKRRDFAGKTPVSAFCLFELSKLPEGLPVVLAALRSAGLELITQAPIDRLTAPEQALEALNDAGLRLARLTVNETPERTWTGHLPRSRGASDQASIHSRFCAAAAKDR